MILREQNQKIDSYELQLKQNIKMLLAKNKQALSLLRSRFKERGPNLYESVAHKYPKNEQEFKNRFYFKVNYFQISMPDSTMDFISDEVYKDSVDKIKDTVDGMKQNVCKKFSESNIFLLCTWSTANG